MRDGVWLKPLVGRAWVGVLATLGWLVLAINALVEGRTTSRPSHMSDPVSSWRFELLTEIMVVLDKMVVPLAGMSLLAFLAFHAARREWRAMTTLGIFSSGGALLSQALKAFVGRERPPDNALVEVSGHSFPSGQVLAVTLVAGWAIHVARTNSGNESGQRAVVTIMTAAVLLVGFSRVYLGAHYVSDVAASILIGVSWWCVCTAALSDAARRNPR